MRIVGFLFGGVFCLVQSRVRTALLSVTDQRIDSLKLWLQSLSCLRCDSLYVPGIDGWNNLDSSGLEAPGFDLLVLERRELTRERRLCDFGDRTSCMVEH